MPRKESLAAITPNRYYDIQAKVKYLHRTQNGATAVIEQDQVQKKVILPAQSHLDQGALYRFSKCFYSNSGWIKVKESSLIEHLKNEVEELQSLEEINQRKQDLYNNYVSISLQIVHIGKPEKVQKNGTSLTFTLLKGFSKNLVVDISLWNQQIPQDYLYKQVLLSGFRLKMLTKGTFMLVSTVYSKFTLSAQSEESELYDSKKQYRSLSQVHGERNILEMKQSLHELTKCFSVIEGKVKQATIFDYQGCKKCHKKLENSICILCGGQIQKQMFQVYQLQLSDVSGECTVFVFDPDLQGAMKMIKKDSLIKCKIRSKMKLDVSDDKNTESHTLVGIKSITF